MEAISSLDPTQTVEPNYSSTLSGSSPHGVSNDSGSFTSALAQFDKIIARVDKRSKQDIRFEKKARREQVKRRHEGCEPFGYGFFIKPSEEAIVASIINFMDSKNTVTLAWPSNQKYLKDQGNKIDHLHPLCFLWAIVKNEDLKAKLRTFRDNSAFALKWNGFLGYSAFHDKGFGKNMEKYYNHRNPQDYQHEFDAFYRSVNLKKEAVNHFAQSKDWKGFTSAVIEPSSYN